MKQNVMSYQKKYSNENQISVAQLHAAYDEHPLEGGGLRETFGTIGDDEEHGQSALTFQNNNSGVQTTEQRAQSTIEQATMNLDTLNVNNDFLPKNVIRRIQESGQKTTSIDKETYESPQFRNSTSAAPAVIGLNSKFSVPAGSPKNKLAAGRVSLLNQVTKRDAISSDAISNSSFNKKKQVRFTNVYDAQNL